MKKFLLITVILLFSILLTITPEIAADAIRSALRLCSTSVIPSIFPFLVLSGITVQSGAVSSISYLFRPLGRFLGFSDNGAGAFILGNLCGFPIGASTAAQMKQRKEISEKEAERLAAISNNVSSGFAISFAGMSVIGDRKVGIALYFCQFLAALAVGFLTRGHMAKSNFISTKKAENEENIFISSVTSASLTTLNITAFVTVFSVISSYISAACASIQLPKTVTAFIICLCEISNGCNVCVLLPFWLKIIFIAFALGFSGVSVLVQSAVFLKKENIKILPFVTMKLLQGAITALLAFIYIKFFYGHITASSAVNEAYTPPLFMSCLSLIIICILIFFLLHKIHLNKRLDLYN